MHNFERRSSLRERCAEERIRVRRYIICLFGFFNFYFRFDTDKTYKAVSVPVLEKREVRTDTSEGSTLHFDLDASNLDYLVSFNNVFTRVFLIFMIRRLIIWRLFRVMIINSLENCANDSKLNLKPCSNYQQKAGMFSKFILIFV